MLEFSNIIRISPIANGVSQTYELVADPFSYIPQFTDDGAGIYWNCDKNIVIDRPNDIIRKYFSIERKAIVTIRTSDRKSYDIGTIAIPARVHISSNLNTCTLIIKCKMLSDPLL